MTEKKPSNPKDALGIAKAPLHCVPLPPLYELGLAMMEGGRKYGTHNYRAIGVRASTYFDASMRHIMAWWEGEDTDPDSGMAHITKAIASLFVLRDAQLMGKCQDDRPIKHPEGLDFNRLNEQVATILEKYPDCAEPFLETTKVLLDDKPKKVGKFTIKKTQDLRKGWYIILTKRNGPIAKFLHKDLELHSTTGWHPEHEYGEAPGYYNSIDQAITYIVDYNQKLSDVLSSWVVRVKNMMHCGWYVYNNDIGLYLHKDFQLHRTTGNHSKYGFGEAPGYWPTKKWAEDALTQYLENQL